jgi:hypothetical protein
VTFSPPKNKLMKEACDLEERCQDPKVSQQEAMLVHLHLAGAQNSGGIRMGIPAGYGSCSCTALAIW